MPAAYKKNKKNSLPSSQSSIQHLPLNIMVATTTCPLLSRAELDPDSPLPYLFSIPGNTAFLVVYLSLAVAHAARYHQEKQQRRGLKVPAGGGQKWSLSLPIAEGFMCLGFAIRLALRSQQDSLALYAVGNLFVILSPTAFIGFIYVLFSRLISALDPSHDWPRAALMKRSKLSPLPPRLIGRLFIWSDVVTFFVQASGGGLQAAGGTMADLGSKVFLAGVSLQAVSYVLFLLIVCVAHIKIVRLRTESPSQLSGISRSQTRSQVLFFFALLYMASLCILIRSVFRIVEMAGGYQGKVYRTETYLFLLDSLPLALANTLWAVWWPPRSIRKVGDDQCQSAVDVHGHSLLPSRSQPSWLLTEMPSARDCKEEAA